MSSATSSAAGSSPPPSSISSSPFTDSDSSSQSSIFDSASSAASTSSSPTPSQPTSPRPASADTTSNLPGSQWLANPSTARCLNDMLLSSKASVSGVLAPGVTRLPTADGKSHTVYTMPTPTMNNGQLEGAWEVTTDSGKITFAFSARDDGQSGLRIRLTNSVAQSSTPASATKWTAPDLRDHMFEPSVPSRTLPSWLQDVPTVEGPQETMKSRMLDYGLAKRSSALSWRDDEAQSHRTRDWEDVLHKWIKDGDGSEPWTEYHVICESARRLEAGQRSGEDAIALAQSAWETGMKRYGEAEGHGLSSLTTAIRSRMADSTPPSMVLAANGQTDHENLGALIANGKRHRFTNETKTSRQMAYGQYTCELLDASDHQDWTGQKPSVHQCRRGALEILNESSLGWRKEEEAKEWVLAKLKADPSCFDTPGPRSYAGTRPAWATSLSDATDDAAGAEPSTSIIGSTVPTSPSWAPASSSLPLSSSSIISRMFGSLRAASPGLQKAFRVI